MELQKPQGFQKNFFYPIEMHIVPEMPEEHIFCGIETNNSQAFGKMCQ